MDCIMAMNRFQCILCFELCDSGNKNDCVVHCMECHQILCHSHVTRISNDKCPNCRNEPFRYQKNIPFQRIIDDLRKFEEQQQQKKNAALLERVVIESKKSSATYEKLKDSWIGILEEFKTKTAKENGLVGTQTQLSGRRCHDDNIIFEGRHGMKVPLRSKRRSNEYEKLPNTSHRKLMKLHVRQCSNESCRTLLTGKWGIFIGGSKGRARFDLTNCHTGKRLNEMIGWNYENPRG